MRERNYLIERYKCILAYTGFVFIPTALLFFLPLTALIGDATGSAGDAWAFVIPGVLLLVCGLLLWRAFRTATYVSLSLQEGGVIVLLSWLGVIIFSMWPFIAILDMSVTHALFESVSGWTTTGLSVVDVTSAGRMILLWRSTMQLAGGAGLAIIMMSAVLGPTGAGVAVAEGRSDQLLPHVRHSARLVLMLYLAYAIAGAGAYRLAGMTWFDAVNHSFAAVSTGGFSTRVDSIGHWNSLAVEAVTLPLMILGNLSFVTAWLIFRGKFRSASRNGELRLSGLLVILTVPALWLGVSSQLYPSLPKAMRVAVFETVTAVTTTGFSTVGYGAWSGLGITILILLMIVGGGTCSTAGGLKQFRVYLLIRALGWEFHRLMVSPRRVLRRVVWEGERQVSVDDARIRQIGVFAFLYMLALALGTLVLCANGYALRESLFEFASALGTVGLSVGVTASDAPSTVLWAETAGMFLGRLEFLVVIAAVGKVIRDFPRVVRVRE